MAPNNGWAVALTLLTALGGGWPATTAHAEKIDLQYTLEWSKTIAEVDDEGSGITFDGKHLYIVNDKPPEIVQLDTDGKYLRTFSLAKRNFESKLKCDKKKERQDVRFHDVEGITHIEGPWFAVVEERRCRICKINLEQDDIRCESPVALEAICDCNNKGLEGITYELETDRFWIAKERAPKRVIRLAKKPADDDPWGPDQPSKPKDFSGIFHDALTHNILLLSHESETLFEYRPGGKKPLRQLSLTDCFRDLKEKHGLDPETTELKAEGVTMDAERHIYVAGEPNFLCKFKPEKP